MRKFYCYLKYIGLVATGLVVGSVATLQFSAAAQSRGGTPLPLEQLQLFAQVFGEIKKDYVKPVEDKALLTAAIKGMVASLDPHSSYLDKEEYIDMLENLDGGFSGLGISISQENGLIKVIAPIEDTPAYRAGVLPGDIITQIDGKSVQGMPLDKAVRKMKGKAGTQVTLTIFRKTENNMITKTITRAVIKALKTVKTKMMTPEYAWIRLTSFNRDTLPDLAQQLKTMAQQQPRLKGIVLDLRSNPGGIIESAVGVASAFLPADVPIVSTSGTKPNTKEIYYNRFANYRGSSLHADPLQALPALFKSLPIVVLTNAYSASASEIVAGALQDHQRALIMGKTTFGKGSVQLLRPLSGGNALRLTTAYYYTPNNRLIQNKGIQPDMLIDHYADGDPNDAYITREADYANHLSNTQNKNEEEEQKLHEQQRIEQLRKLAEAQETKKSLAQRSKERERQPVTFGSDNDFMLQQALHYLKGEPVQLSKSAQAHSMVKNGQQGTSPAVSAPSDQSASPAGQE
jgi:carboxyl-terminal processing protease